MSVVIDGTLGITSPAETITTNLTFTGTGNRITGDFTNATVANRVAFQTSTANSATVLHAIPSGTGTSAFFEANNASDFGNAAHLQIGMDGANSARIASSIRGTGTYLPMTFNTGGSERARIDTSGNVGIGTASPSAKFHVVGNNNGIAASASAGNAVSLYLAGNGNTFGSTSFDITQDSSNNAIVYQRANGPLIFGTNNTERMRIDSSGNVGIGVTPSAWSGFSALDIGSGGLGFYSAGMQQNSYYNGTNWIYKTTNLAAQYLQSGGVHRWWTAPSGTAGNAITFTQAMTLDASGNLLVGVTAYPTGSGYTGGLFGPFGSLGAASRNTKPVMFGSYSTSAGLPQYTGNWASSGSWGIGPHSGSNDTIIRIGILAADGSGAYWSGSYVNIYAGSYTNASDYRIKENVTDVVDGVLAKVLALRVVNYNIIHQPDEDGDVPTQKDEVGFIAHEIQEQFPILVSGEKDDVDGDGNAQHQGVDYAKMSAYLVKSIQEQQALIIQLQADVAALKALSA